MTRPDDSTPDIDRCPVCQHWPAPHRRGTCAGTVGRDNTGVDVICGCDGAEYGLAARLHFMEADIAAVVRAGTQAAHAGLATTEALTLLRTAVGRSHERLTGLLEVFAGLVDSVTALERRTLALERRMTAAEARTAEVDASVTHAQSDIDKLWRTGSGDPE